MSLCTQGINYQDVLLLQAADQSAFFLSFEALAICVFPSFVFPNTHHNSAAGPLLLSVCFWTLALAFRLLG